MIVWSWKLNMHNFICTQTLCINFRAVHAKLQVKGYGQICVHRQTDGQTDIKIAHAQLHIHTNIICNFESSTCKNVGVMLWITMI